MPERTSSDLLGVFLRKRPCIMRARPCTLRRSSWNWDITTCPQTRHPYVIPGRITPVYSHLILRCGGPQFAFMQPLYLKIFFLAAVNLFLMCFPHRSFDVKVKPRYVASETSLTVSPFSTSELLGRLYLYLLVKIMATVFSFEITKPLWSAQATSVLIATFILRKRWPRLSPDTKRQASSANPTIFTPCFLKASNS